MSDHILVIHRWRDRYALYADYIDHSAHHVTYVTTVLGRQSIPDSAAGIVTVRETDDFHQVKQAVDTLSVRFGPPARVVALNEGDLDTAALLRAQLGCPGQSPMELARFRDKLTMTEIVACAGIRTPAFADAPDPEAVREFAETHGWPVIVKPRRGTASRGVLRIGSPGELDGLAAQPPEARLVQTFCPDGIFHVDGVWTGTALGPWRASRYVNTCVDFTEGQALGSVEEDDPALLGPLGEFTAAVAAALGGRRPWVFHLEVFVGPGEGGGSPRLTFLEAGCRVGGAEIPFIWREVHGLDLMAAAAAIQLGHDPVAAPSSRPRQDGRGGWLLVPTPVPAPCEVVAAALPSAGGTAGPYTQVVPPVGYVMPKVGGYEHVGARFRFRGSTTHEVEKAIQATADQFTLDCVAVEYPRSPVSRGGCGLDR
ncbi:acetyl-CoA carboxylase biotin carboxylase subunit family protein [Streptomyces sp. ISL-11]|uniref:ATP-grasp domain-containing protein n=1 Tax=Streptomyces sp. ISL-11 TaxID=2819174 RepID=UPI001BE8078F|nr:biotin carboxylase [Streptomyces sp. ISL-11]MBT2383370.1 biotin carboxylase [Streptomyces sp. ISL-11]